MTPARLTRVASFGALILISAVVTSGCTLFDSPQNVFAPAGEVAKDQRNLFFITMWPAVAIMILVEGMLVLMAIKFRRRRTDTAPPPQVHGNNQLEIAWTVAPIILLALFVIPVVGGIVDLGKKPKDALIVDVTAVQWAWQFAYQDPNGGETPIPANFDDPLHVPLGKDVYLRLHSNDVIHSFWVPKLAGKTDVVPGRTNHMWIRGDELGTYSGQCAEFCGLDHANMRFQVIVESVEDYNAYVGQLVAANGGGSDQQLAQEGD